MASIHIFDTQEQAAMESDLALYPIRPDGIFTTPIANLLLPKDGSNLTGYKFAQLDIQSKLKTMSCFDICGIMNDYHVEPFVIAKTLHRGSLHPLQIRAFAAMVLGQNHMKTPFSLFMELEFGAEHPSEHNGCVFIDAVPTGVIIDETNKAFREWGGRVLFSKM